MNLDAQLALLLNGLAGQSHFLDGLIIFFASPFGFLLITAFLVLLCRSEYAKTEKLRFLFIVITSSTIARAILTELIRFFVNRPRPFSELPVNELFVDTAWSFPSGHAAFFFAMATAIYLHNKQWGKYFLAGAALIAVSRVIAGVHYLSDIIAGAIIGILVAIATFRAIYALVIRKQNQTS